MALPALTGHRLDGVLAQTSPQRPHPYHEEIPTITVTSPTKTVSFADESGLRMKDSLPRPEYTPQRDRDGRPVIGDAGNVTPATRSDNPFSSTSLKSILKGDVKRKRQQEEEKEHDWLRRTRGRASAPSPEPQLPKPLSRSWGFGNLESSKPTETRLPTFPSSSQASIWSQQTLKIGSTPSTWREPSPSSDGDSEEVKARKMSIEETGPLRPAAPVSTYIWGQPSALSNVDRSYEEFRKMSIEQTPTVLINPSGPLSAPIWGGQTSKFYNRNWSDDEPRKMSIEQTPTVYTTPPTSASTYTWGQVPMSNSNNKNQYDDEPRKMSIEQTPTVYINPPTPASAYTWGQAPPMSNNNNQSYGEPRKMSIDETPPASRNPFGTTPHRGQSSRSPFSPTPSSLGEKPRNPFVTAPKAGQQSRSPFLPKSLQGGEKPRNPFASTTTTTSGAEKSRSPLSTEQTTGENSRSPFGNVPFGRNQYRSPFFSERTGGESSRSPFASAPSGENQNRSPLSGASYTYSQDVDMTSDIQLQPDHSSSQDTPIPSIEKSCTWPAAQVVPELEMSDPPELEVESTPECKHNGAGTQAPDPPTPTIEMTDTKDCEPAPILEEPTTCVPEQLAPHLEPEQTPFENELADFLNNLLDPIIIQYLHPSILACSPEIKEAALEIEELLAKNAVLYESVGEDHWAAVYRAKLEEFVIMRAAGGIQPSTAFFEVRGMIERNQIARRQEIERAMQEQAEMEQKKKEEEVEIERRRISDENEEQQRQLEARRKEAHQQQRRQHEAEREKRKIVKEYESQRRQLEQRRREMEAREQMARGFGGPSQAAHDGRPTSHSKRKERGPEDERENHGRHENRHRGHRDHQRHNRDRIPTGPKADGFSIKGAASRRERY